MSYKRGEIFYIERAGDSYGSEQQAGRPAIVVSNDKNNEYSSTLEVVYLTTQPKTELPTHIDIRSTKKNSIALCEQVHTVSVQRVGDFVCNCSEYEMQMIDAALLISLGIDFEKQQKETKQEVVKPETSKESGDVVVRLTTERDIYKSLYEQILERVAK
jgi:mRNA interferase MazF